MDPRYINTYVCLKDEDREKLREYRDLRDDYIDEILFLIKEKNSILNKFIEENKEINDLRKDLLIIAAHEELEILIKLKQEE